MQWTEARGRIDGAPLARLAAGEGLERPPELPVNEACRLLDLLEGELVGVVEEDEDGGLEEADGELALAQREAGLDDAVAEEVHPHQLPPGVLLEVKVLEALLVALHVRRQAALHRRVRRPEPRREHRHPHLAARARLLERHHHVPRQVHILEHPFQLRRELRPALRLELRDHALLRVERRRLPQQQPLRQVLLVERLEDVLPLDEPEEHEHLLERRLELLVRLRLVARLEQAVDVAGDELGGAVRALLDERLAGAERREGGCSTVWGVSESALRSGRAGSHARSCFRERRRL